MVNGDLSRTSALLHARVALKNMGASKFTLLRRGTGLRVSVLAPNQPAAPASAAWDVLKVFEFLTDHKWIEPAETISDDLLLDLGVSTAVPTLFEARLVLKRTKLFGGNIAVLARQVIPIDSTIGGSEKAAAAGGKEGRSSP